MSDESLGIIVGVIIYSLIWIWILYEVIKGAAKSTKQTQHLIIQTRLLAELLSKQGVDNNKIMEIINVDKPYFKSEQSKSKT